MPKRIYLVKEVGYRYDTHLVFDYADEALFLRKSKALKYLRRRLAKKQDKLSLHKRLLIMRLEPNRKEDTWKSRKEWWFDSTGKLLKVIDFAVPEPSMYDQFTCEGKYGVGEIVHIKPSLFATWSRFVGGEFAVVVRAPIRKNLLTTKIARQGWWPCYELYFIYEDGLIDHCHLTEDDIEKCEVLPPTHKFLQVLSQAVIANDEAFLKRLFAEPIFLLNTAHFDFSMNELVSAVHE